MLVNIKKIFVAAAVLASFSAIGQNAASATSLTGVSVGGTNPNDTYVYDVNGNNTVKVLSTQANIQKVLSGDATNPTGNVELAASSEQNGFDFSNNTTSLNGTIGGRAITLSSLTLADWNTNVGGQTFAKKWFGELLAANNLTSTVSFLEATYKFNLFDTFVANGGLQRFSDPNISYVNQDNDNVIRIGLAGHLNATPIIQKSLPANFAALLNNRTIQASEIVKVTYDGEAPKFLYGFKATSTGLVSQDDLLSHSGNYEVTFQGKAGGVSPASVPEPSMLFGLISIGGMVVAKRKLNKNA